MWALASYRVGDALGFGVRMCAVDRDETGWFICSSTIAAFEPRTFLVHLDAYGAAQVYELGDELVSGGGIAYDALSHQLLLGGQAPEDVGIYRIVRWDIATEEVTGRADAPMPTSPYNKSSWTRGIIGRRLWFVAGGGIAALDVDTMTVVRQEVIGAVGGFPGGDVYSGVYVEDMHTFWTVEAVVGAAGYYLDRLESQGVTLETIVQDLSRRAGLAPSDVVTAGLTELVRGYVVNQRGEARAALEPLCQAFFVDGVESDWALRFMHRALAPVATLTRQDLAAHEAGSTLPDVLTPERLDDLQIPIRVDVTYPDPDNDYQDNNQHARRMQAGQRARSERSVRAPIMLGAGQAKQVAEQTLAEAWVQRMTYRFTLPYRWATLDPGDVVTVDEGTRSNLLRLTTMELGANGVLDVQAMAYDREVYTASLSTGVLPSIVRTQTLLPVPPTLLLLMDIPLLRDIDDSSGYYLGMSPQGTGVWSGAVALSSVDATSWREEATVTVAVDYGSAVTVLGPGSPYVIDHGHTVDVRLVRGTLESCTALDMLNGANAYLLGQEIFQAQTVTLLAPGLYRLSILLRGRRGTEHFIANHTPGERFVVLSPRTLRRGQMGLSEVGTTRLYQAVSLGTDVFTTASQPFVNTARGVQCYSVEHLTGTWDDSDNLTLTWVRRARVGGAWSDGRDVPLGEATEAYEVDIVVGGVVTRTLASTTPTVTYTAAQQTLDGLTPGGPVTVTVYQLGQTGRGVPRTATV
jgi:hypothetical protein